MVTATHPSGYLKGCQCERCTKQRERSREYAKTYQHPDPQKRRRYKTGKQRQYDAKPGVAEKKREYSRNRAREWYLKNPDGYWVHGLKSNHGMLPEQWFAMLTEQAGRCYLCERPLSDDRAKIAIDHDHSHCPSGRSCAICRRGLAHHQCNSSIGLLEDDPALLRLIADNLERVKRLTAELILSAPKQDQLF